MKIKFFLLLFLMSLLFFSLSAQTFEEMISKSQALYKNGEYLEAAHLSEAAFKEGQPSKLDYFNNACNWALAGNKENAFSNLEKAIEAGWIYKHLVTNDKDLTLLHSEERFTLLLDQIVLKEQEMLNALPTHHEETELIELPDPVYTSNYTIEQTLKERRSTRSFSDEPLTLKEVSQVLWSAYGVTYHQEGMPEFLRGGFKTAPSAGALYPLEIYLVATNVTDLKKGIYKYKPEGHKLIMINHEDARDELLVSSYYQMMVKEAPANIVYSAIFSRTTEKYGERGRERYVYMDLGHSAENVYLQTVSLNMGTCAIGAFDDLKVRILLNMTAEEEPLYIMPLGKIQKDDD